MTLQYKLFNNLGLTPEQKTKEAACYDLYMPTEGIIEAGCAAHINLQIGFEFVEPGYCLHMYGRSSALAVHGLVIPTTIIDADYRGPVHLIVYNTTLFDFAYQRGDRFCQIQIVPVLSAMLKEVDYLSETERNHKGLGSTGL